MGTDISVILVVLLVLDIGLVIAVFTMGTRIRTLSAKTGSLARNQSRVSQDKELMQQIAKLERYAKKANSEGQLAQIEDVIRHSVHKYGIVKYDAFDDVGGKLSFVLALLDDMDSGFVLNAVHSRENCFLYIKEIVRGESYIMLSNEEVEALRIARRYGSDEYIEE